MKSKLISFPDGHFERKKPHPLTSLMINTLLDACEKQKEGIRFGPTDIKGSLGVLITRGLIVRREVAINKHIESLWQVSPEAIEMLKVNGISVTC
ncbi:MAG TPA: hypothetical protein VGP55_08345 [Chitinophagaceae bacterium]|nr:hypothetical protein [Chitinophagaceae bacterium]